MFHVDVDTNKETQIVGLLLSLFVVAQSILQRCHRLFIRNGVKTDPDQSQIMNEFPHDEGYGVCTRAGTRTMRPETRLLDFCCDDGSWYEVSLGFRYDSGSVSQGVLTLYYQNRPEKTQECFSVNSAENLNSLLEKFRMPVIPLLEYSCQRMRCNMKVFVRREDSSLDFMHLRDASIREIFRNKHETVDGRDECMCKCRIEWLNGPDFGQRAVVHSEDLYVQQPGKVKKHPVIKEIRKFLKLKVKKTEKIPMDGSSGVKDCMYDVHNSTDNEGPSKKKLKFDNVEKDAINNSNLSQDMQRKSSNVIMPSSYLKNAEILEDCKPESNETSSIKNDIFKQEQDEKAFPCIDIELYSFMLKKDNFSNKSTHLHKCSQNVDIEDGLDTKIFGYHGDDMKNTPAMDTIQTSEGIQQCLVKNKNFIILNDSPACGVAESHNIKDFMCREVAENLDARNQFKVMPAVYEVQQCDLPGITNEKPLHASNIPHETIVTNQNNDLDVKSCVSDGGNDSMQCHDSMFSLSNIILLENLEKDITTTDISCVIHQVTSSSVKVYISPVYEFECFTKAYVCFKDHESFSKVLEYLQQDNIYVISSSGRPWVVSEGIGQLSDDACKSFSVEYDALEEVDQGLSTNRIRVVSEGSSEYTMAKKRKRMFLEWKDDLICLHRRLDYELS